MKKLITVIVTLNVCLAAVLGGMFYLAETYPFQPGDALFGLQAAAEDARVSLSPNALSRSEMSFVLVERRLADLAMAPDAPAVDLALAAVDHNLSHAIRSIEDVSTEDQAALYAQMDRMLERTEIVLAGVAAKHANPLVAELTGKVARLQAALSPAAMQNMVAEAPSLPAIIQSKVISFLGKDVEHENFPLEKGHARLDCLDCHADGTYAEVATECSACHTLDAELTLLRWDGLPLYRLQNQVYQQHFEGECSDCHSLAGWGPTVFAHEGVVECVSCHANDLPTDEYASLIGPLRISLALDPIAAEYNEPLHYPGECMLCHTDTEAWQEAAYDHEGVVECASCHQAAEADHTQFYAGECMNCHKDVEDWTVLEVDHSAYPACFDCHVDDTPAAHYKGLCSNCHNTTDWAENFFDHEPGSDCRSCHEEPAVHPYAGQCGTCHSMRSWTDNVFDHSLRMCASCHEAPAGHYPGACSTCHSTGHWSKVRVNHSGQADCLECHAEDIGPHYEGQCSNCHVTYNWGTVSFNHVGLEVCTQCHNPPDLHYGGECSNCHTVFSWGQINFDHSGYTDCADCHETPANHYPGACDTCHVPSSWENIVYNHKLTDNCQNCHAKEGHWPGQCSKCHGVTAWELVDFDHTGYTDCKSCHVRPANHPRGQCSRCHDTESWWAATEAPTEEPEDPAPALTETPAPITTPEPPVTVTPAPLETVTPAPSVTVTLVVTDTPDPFETPEP